MDELKLFQEVNRILKKMRIKNSRAKSKEGVIIEIGNFRLGKDEWFNGVHVDGTRNGFGIHHESREITKFGYFINGSIQGFAKLQIQNSMCYFGNMHGGKFVGEVLLYIFKANVFSESFYSKNNKNFEISKGLGIPLEKVYKLFQQNVGFYECKFFELEDYFKSDIIEYDNKGSFIRITFNFIEFVF
jgi:hypothetical protein